MSTRSTAPSGPTHPASGPLPPPAGVSDSPTSTESSWGPPKHPPGELPQFQRPKPPTPEEQLESLLDDDDNVLTRLGFAAQKSGLFKSMSSLSSEFEALVCDVLGVPWCTVPAEETWQSGSFNLAIPIVLPDERTVWLRVPLDYRLKEAGGSENVEEKLRTEVATYMWMTRHCSDVPIPTLHAFGLPDGSRFTNIDRTSKLSQAWAAVKDYVYPLLGWTQPQRYVRARSTHSLPSGFLLLSNAKGSPLASSWFRRRRDPAYRQRLFRGLAQIELSMNAHSVPRLGSFSYCADGTVKLANRPLHVYFQMFENEGVPSGIPRNRTYGEVDGFLSDLLSFQDNKLRHQPNAVHDEGDGRMQMAALTALRAISHHFLPPETRQGPFFYTLTDLQQHNIFVDEEWNITSVIDLEWAHSLPSEMQLPPYWLTSKAVDDFSRPEDVTYYEWMLDEYFKVYAEEEEKRNGRVVHASVKRETWQNGRFWFTHAVFIPKGMYTIFNRHIQPLFNEEHPERRVFDDVFFWYWGRSAQTLIDEKIQGKAAFLERVKEAFWAEKARLNGVNDPIEPGANA